MVAGIFVSHWNENSLSIFHGLSAVPGAGAAPDGDGGTSPESTFTRNALPFGSLPYRYFVAKTLKSVM